MEPAALYNKLGRFLDILASSGTRVRLAVGYSHIAYSSAVPTALSTNFAAATNAENLQLILHAYGFAPSWSQPLPARYYTVDDVLGLDAELPRSIERELATVEYQLNPLKVIIAQQQDYRRRNGSGIVFHAVFDRDTQQILARHPLEAALRGGEANPYAITEENFNDVLYAILKTAAARNDVNLNITYTPGTREKTIAAALETAYLTCALPETDTIQPAALTPALV